MPAFATRLLASTILAAALALPAAAQEVRDLDKETSTSRSFTGFVGAEPVLFEVSLPADTSLTVEAISTSSIDPFLKVSNARTGEVIGEDDDGGGELNAKLTIRAEERNRRIAIAVSQFMFGSEEMGGETGGAFELRLTNFVPTPAEAIDFGGSADGTLTLGEERHFRITGKPGMILEVALDAGEDSGFDPYLRLLDDVGTELASDDDGGDGLNSRLSYLMQDDSPLTIVASGYGEAAGDFTLRVAKLREPIVQAPLQVIGIDDAASGRLGAGYEAGGIDPQSIDYQLSEEALAAIAGGMHEVTVKMVAKADEDGMGGGLDSYLELGFDTPLGFAVVESDDDGAGELDAMIPVDLSGVAADPALLARLRIRAQAFSGSTGDYTLTITEGMEARAVTDFEVIEAVEEAIEPTTPPAPPPIRIVPAD